MNRILWVAFGYLQRTLCLEWTCLVCGFTGKLYKELYT